MKADATGGVATKNWNSSTPSVPSAPPDPDPLLPGAGEAPGLGDAAELAGGLWLALAAVDALGLADDATLALADGLALAGTDADALALADSTTEALADALAAAALVPIAFVATTRIVARMVIAEGMRTARLRTSRGR
jgi:hypothetical protein